ncbi:hypothetical protein [Chitinophaga sp. sic0106]|uniref:hypothetical protein n=1 Tax=Chitinophaga sp. sic0106 TaxID=2854785 RepID=UPI001C43C716|nr:hypothetical protein [Chitinophaga sp. sic0106]MBV7529052.1 hypothetical protein [Chitinophaga sp. sic0106]
MSNKELLYSCNITPVVSLAVDAVIQKIIKNKGQYSAVEAVTGVPWWWIGIIHLLECGGRFDLHLHNGDPLTNKTVRAPKGRPVVGAPPFTWVDSAIDAMQLQSLDKESLRGGTHWSLDYALEKMERYNGLGYRMRGVPSPYLWAGSQHYKAGKFTTDGRYDPKAISKQLGGAVVLSRMISSNLVKV